MVDAFIVMARQVGELVYGLTLASVLDEIVDRIFASVDHGAP